MRTEFFDTPGNFSLDTGHSYVRYINEFSLHIDRFSSNFDDFFKVYSRQVKDVDNKQSFGEGEINFWGISDKIRLNLNEDFCRKLFDNCKLDFNALAKELGISYPFVGHLRRTRYSMPLRIALKLSELSNTPLNEIQDNLLSVRTRSGTVVKLKFPIKANEAFASLVGHVFGDGYIGKNKKYFEFCNFNPNLIRQVKHQIFETFGLKPMTERKDRVGYPTIVGEILAAFGAPIAPKIYSERIVPEWILSSKNHQKAFLKSFFDDDGSVMFSKNYNAKGISLSIIRHIDQKEGALFLLNQIKNMLSNFEVYSGNPIISKSYDQKDGKHIIVYINITDYRSIANFHNRIGLTSGEKNEKLTKILKKKNYYNKRDEINLNNDILTLLSERSYSTAEVASLIKKSRTRTLQKLNLLESKGKLEICGKIAVNRLYLWKIKPEEKM